MRTSEQSELDEIDSLMARITGLKTMIAEIGESVTATVRPTHITLRPKVYGWKSNAARVVVSWSFRDLKSTPVIEHIDCQLQEITKKQPTFALKPLRELRDYCEEEYVRFGNALENWTEIARITGLPIGFVNAIFETRLSIPTAETKLNLDILETNVALRYLRSTLSAFECDTAAVIRAFRPMLPHPDMVPFYDVQRQRFYSVVDNGEVYNHANGELEPINEALVVNGNEVEYSDKLAIKVCLYPYYEESLFYIRTANSA